MSRRRQDVFDQRKQQIIDGALQVFSERGFKQATNKDIAKAAGINSPGLIYHYFADKANLLRAVVESYAPPLQLVAHPEEMMTLPPAEALTRFGLTYLALMEDPKVAATLKLIVGEALRDPEFAAAFAEIGPLRVWRFLEDYLNQQMETGVLRHTDARLAARCFIGPLILQLLTRSILPLPGEREISPEALIRVHVDIFLHGLQGTS